MTKKTMQRALILNRIQTRSERRFLRELKAFYRRAVNEVISASSPDDTRESFKGKLSIIMQRLYLVAARESGDEVTRQLNQRLTKTNEDLFELAVLAWIKNKVAEKVKSLEESFFASIREAIDEGFRDGLSENDVAKKIKKDVGNDYAKWKAKRIARTEAAAANNKGAHEAAKASGLDIVKEWVSAEDARTRPSHNEANGQTREIDDYFVVGNGRLLYPGDPDGGVKEVVNCRCVALYHPRVNGEVLK